MHTKLSKIKTYELLKCFYIFYHLMVMLSPAITKCKFSFLYFQNTNEEIIIRNLLTDTKYKKRKYLQW